ncbi:MAG: hypothetical protein N2Z58_02090 [Fervidobacterium sp.]|nr:hypothetical protein [Fervidobacterium sp.]
MKKIVTLNLFLITFIAFGMFIDNPVNLLVNGNVIFVGSEFYDLSDNTLKVAWQQREGVLCGELGYTTDSNFSYGMINYKLSHMKNLYGLNVKFNVLPVEKFFIRLDASGRIVLNNYALINFGFNDLSLLVMDTSMSSVPTVFGGIDLVFGKNFELSFTVNNFETNKVRFSLGFGAFGFSPVNRLAVFYSPIYRLSDGKLFNIVEGIIQTTLSNFSFSLAGFYNISDTVSDDRYLKYKYGIKFSLGVQM